jgi:hypothetical protein
MQEVLSKSHHVGNANQTEWKLYNTGKDYQWNCIEDRNVVIFAEGTKHDPPEHILFFKFRYPGKYELLSLVFNHPKCAY